MPSPTYQEVYESIANSLVEFGYPGVTPSMIEETYNAMSEGKTGHTELPHGVISAFAEKQIKEAMVRDLLPLFESDDYEKRLT